MSFRQTTSSSTDARAQSQVSTDDQLSVGDLHENSDTARVDQLHKAYNNLTVPRRLSLRRALASLDPNVSRRRKIQGGEETPHETQAEHSPAVDSNDENSSNQLEQVSRVDLASQQKISKEQSSSSFTVLREKLELRGMSTRRGHEERRQRAQDKLVLEALRSDVPPQFVRPEHTSGFHTDSSSTVLLHTEMLNTECTAKAPTALNDRSWSQRSMDQHQESPECTSEVDFGEYWRLPLPPQTPNSRVSSGEIEAAILAMLSVGEEEEPQLEDECNGEQAPEGIDSRTSKD